MEAVGNDGGEEDVAVVVVGLGNRLALGVDEGDQVAAGGREAELHAGDTIHEEGVHPGEKLVEAITGLDRGENRVGEMGTELVEGDGVAGELVGLVEDDEALLVARPELIEHVAGRLIVVVDIRAGGIDDVDEEIGEERFLEGRFEGFHKPVGQAADETDGIGEEKRLAVRKIDAPGGCIEGGEKLVLGQDVGGGDLVEERRLAGIGVADDGAVGDRKFFASLAAGAPLLADFGEFALRAVDPLAGDAPVDLDLLFPLAPGGGPPTLPAAGPPALAVEVRPHPREARQRVLHAGELDLEASLLGLGAQGEDIEDDFLAVDDGEVSIFFPSALLGGAELVVENDDVALEVFRHVDEFGALAGTHEVARRLLGDAHEFGGGGLDAQRADEFLQFLQQAGRLIGIAAVEVHPDEEGTLDHFGFFSDFEHDGHIYVTPRPRATPLLPGEVFLRDGRVEASQIMGLSEPSAPIHPPRKPNPMSDFHPPQYDASHIGHHHLPQIDPDAPDRYPFAPDLGHNTDRQLEDQQKKSKMTAVGVAVLVHVVIALLAVLIIVVESVNDTPAITITGGDDPTQPVLNKQQLSQRVKKTPSQTSAQAIPTITTNVAANIAIPEVTDFSPDALDLGTMGIGNGFGFDAMGTNFSGAEFLGLRGGGKDIVIVIDTSSSMPGNCKPEGIAAIQKEISKTINGLPALTSFNLICYANDADLFAEKPVLASADNKKAALKFMEGYFGKGPWLKTRTMEYGKAGKDKEGIKYIPRAPNDVPELEGTSGGSRIDLGLILAFKQKPSAVFILSDGAPSTRLNGKPLDDRDIVNFIEDVYQEIYGKGNQMTGSVTVNSVSINGLGENFLRDISRTFNGKHKDIRPDKL